jgi:hypothetical protein
MSSLTSKANFFYNCLLLAQKKAKAKNNPTMIKVKMNIALFVSLLSNSGMYKDTAV